MSGEVPLRREPPSAQVSVTFNALKKNSKMKTRTWQPNSWVTQSGNGSFVSEVPYM